MSKPSLPTVTDPEGKLMIATQRGCLGPDPSVYAELKAYPNHEETARHYFDLVQQWWGPEAAAKYQKGLKR